MTASSVAVSGLRVTRSQRGHTISITDDVDLRVLPGESIAIVGESGSGKSITARAILDLLPHGLVATGDIELLGRALASLSRRQRRLVRGAQVAMVMQDPFTMLNPLQRIGKQVTASVRDHRGRRLRGAARREDARRRLAEVGITDPDVVDRYPFELSGGMRQRVGIAAAIAANPKVLIADEPTTALDVTTQKEILELLSELRRTHQLSVVLITHDLRVAFSFCDRVYVMYAGEVVEVGSSAEVLAAPAHPYTANLLLADPPVDRRVAALANIPGSVPSPGRRPAGCRFAPRCPHTSAACERTQALRPVADGHAVRCDRAEELRDLLLPAGEQEAGTAADPPECGDAPVIVTIGAQRRFGAKVAVRDASIVVHERESVGLVGESGSGKTTLARMLIGLTTPTSGRVQVAGVDVGAATTPAGWEVVRSTVQMAFQDPYSTLNPHRSIGATLRDGLRLVARDRLRERTDELLELVGLPAAYQHRRPAQLSGGERQRVAIARALARDPRVLICDEVVSALDVSVQAHILNLLRRLQSELGLALVFITHDLAVVRQMTDRVYVMRGGEIVEQGATADVLDRPVHDYTRRLIASIPTPHVTGVR
jgi:peptide/nickel transport system ATP-binding protein